MLVDINQTVLKGTANKVAWTVDLEQIPEANLSAMIEGLIAQGVTIILQRVKSGEDLETRQKEVPIVAGKIQGGTYPFGQGGGGGTLDPDTGAILDVVKQGKDAASKKATPKTLGTVLAAAAAKLGLAVDDLKDKIRETDDYKKALAFRESKQGSVAEALGF